LVFTQSHYSESIVIEIVNDGEQKKELDEEVGIELNAPFGVKIVDEIGVGVIDSTPYCIPLLFAAACALDVGLGEPSRTQTTVRFSAIDGTARAGEDFQGIQNGSEIIPAGGTSAEISVWILPNSPGEPEEYFDLQVDVIDAAGVRIDHGRSRVTIRQ
jgi:hypothetical protein